MHRTGYNERRGKETLHKQYGNTVYNTMIKQNHREAAKEAFYRPPYYLTVKKKEIINGDGG